MAIRGPGPPLEDERVETPREELASPTRRRSVVVLAIAALVLGLGLGNVFGSSARDRDDLAGQLDDRTVELEVTQARTADLEDRVEYFRRLLVEEARARAAAEEDMAGLAGAAAAGRDAGEPPDGTAARTSAALVRWVLAVRSGDRAELVDAYAPRAVVSVQQHEITLVRTTGAGRAGALAAQSLLSDLRLTGRVRAHGGLAAAGYVHSAGTGVVAVRIVHGRIVRQWFFLDGSF